MENQLTNEEMERIGKIKLNPPEERETTLENKIQELVGEASMCWSDIENAGVFQSDRAVAISDRIIKLFNDEFNKLPKLSDN